MNTRFDEKLENSTIETLGIVKFLVDQDFTIPDNYKISQYQLV